MKNLIENSVSIKGLGKGPNAITVFNLTSESDKTKIKYVDISKVSGKTVNVEYSYTENQIKKSESITVDISNNMSEVEVRDLIINQINNALNN